MDIKKQGGFAQIIVILVVLALIGGAYYFGTLKNKPNLSPAVSVQPSSNPTVKPTTDPTASWKTYTTKDGKWSFKYPSGWVLTDNSKNVDLYGDGKIQFQKDITLSSGEYKIKSYDPLAWSPSVCIFSDSPEFNNPYSDNLILANSKCPGDFIEIKGLQSTFRRRTVPNTDPEGKPNGQWTVFVKDPNGNFVTVPPITYQIPLEHGQSTILQMDQILSTFKFTN